VNKLILIGNGFDLAHGLKTRYIDFILWYLNDVLQNLVKIGKYSDILLDLKFTFGINARFNVQLTSTEQFNQLLTTNKNDFEYDIKSSLLKVLLSRTSDLNWVDIESEYYQYLINLYKQLEKYKFNNLDFIEKQVILLNEDFNFIKAKLQEYLNSIESSNIELIPDIVTHFNNHFATVPNSQSFLMFLNFNYTSTINNYLEEIKHQQYNVNFIHGKLNDENNKMIFGYGDEIDSYYQKIENVNRNTFLENFKSFGYLLTTNYQDFSNFLENNQFELFIFGHSCGLSDRTMLNKIVMHKNCRNIKIFYFEKSTKKNDYLEKTYELSRHFSPEKKGRMREIIESYTESKPLVKYSELLI
jgi:Bacteriophage abortive infection AbiH